MSLQILEASQISASMTVESESHLRPRIERARSEISTACFMCGAESLNNMTCCYCWKSFCEAHWYQHVTWEKGHEEFAEDYAKMWKTKPVLAKVP